MNRRGFLQSMLATSVAASLSPRALLAGEITSFDLTAPVTGSHPFMLGIFMAKGDAPRNVITDLPTAQCVVESRWQDGSAKRVIVSGRANLIKDRPLSVGVREGSALPGLALTSRDIQKRAPSAIVRCGDFGEVRLVDLLASPTRTRFSGPHTAEAHYETSLTDELWIGFQVRLFSHREAWVKAIVEHRYSGEGVPKRLVYDPYVEIDGQMVFDNGGKPFTHLAQSRYHFEGWTKGTTPPNVERDNYYNRKFFRFVSEPLRYGAP